MMQQQQKAGGVQPPALYLRCLQPRSLFDVWPEIFDRCKAPASGLAGNGARFEHKNEQYAYC